MSRVPRGSGLIGNDGTDWWQVLKNIIEGRAPNDDGGLSLKPEDFELKRRTDLNTTVSGSLYSSSLAQKYGINNLKFYKLIAFNNVEPVSNNRIAVIVRKYNDGQIGLVFYDYGSNSIVVPGNINLNSNITASNRQYGEYVIRNGGPTSGNDPLYGDTSINGAMNIFTNSSSMDQPTPTPPTPPTPEQKEKTFSASDLYITFRQMQGRAAVIYNGQVTVKQEKKDGYWVINFYDTNGNTLGVADKNSSRQIWRRLWSGGDSGYKVPDSYLIEADNDALGWVGRAFNTQPQPAPPQPDPPALNKFSITLSSDRTKLLAYDWDGQKSIAVEQFVIHFEQQTDGSYQIYATPLQSSKRLWINADRVGDKPLTRLSNGNWEIPAGDLPENATTRDVSTFFLNNFKNEPAPPSGPPAPPAGFKRITGNSDSSPWKFLRLVNEDGSAFTGDYYIDYKQQKFGNSYSGSVQDVQFFTFDSQGNKKYIKADFGNVSWGMGGYSGSPIFDSKGDIIGEKYNFSLPNNSRGSFEDFLNQYYDTDNNLYPPEPTPGPPTPPPTPPEPPAPPAPVGLTNERKVGRLNTNDHPGLQFFDSAGNKIEDDNIELYTRGDVDGDGKNEIYFLTVRGEPVSIDKVNGYDYDDFPEPDTSGTGRRRLPGGDVVLYDIDAGIDDLSDLFENGFGARERETIKELNLLESLPIKAFILYNRKGKDGPKIENKDNRMEHLWITGIIKHDINGLPKFYDLSDLEEKKNDIDGIESAEEQGEQSFSGTFESRGGEPAPERFDLYSPPNICGGTGTGRRLMVCGPDEPAPEYKEHKNEYSRMELLNFERNRMENDEKDLPDYTKTQFERMRSTDNERELISMYGSFSSASYIPEDKRPESLFGLDYDKKHSTHNMATYVGRGNKNAVISIRGTKPGNIVDLASDALILSGYEESLSVRFEQSLKEVKRIMDAHPGTNFTLSSHSLGGTINEYIINELKGTEYEKRVKAISFNPGKAPNVKTERAKEISDLVTDASVIKALKEQDPRFLPIMGSIQRDLGISTEMLTNPDILTNDAEMERIIQNYPELSRSFNGLMERLGRITTLEGRTAEAEAWIAENETLLGSINYTASLGNIIKTKIMFDLMLKLFDFSANYTIDQFLERESAMDRKMGKAVRPYDVLWSEGNNVIFKYKNDPISLHHSFFEDERQNVRTYKGKEVSVLSEGIQGKLSQGLKEHGMDNFLIDSHKKMLDHSETWSEYFGNLLNDNAESFSETLNGLRTKLDEKSKEYIREYGWADFLGLL